MFIQGKFQHVITISSLITSSLWKADADLSATSDKAKAAASKCKRGAAKDIIDAGSIKLVMAGSGCESAEKVEQVRNTCKILFLCSILPHNRLYHQ